MFKKRSQVNLPTQQQQLQRTCTLKTQPLTIDLVDRHQQMKSGSFPLGWDLFSPQSATCYTRPWSFEITLKCSL